jgi:hypothetical protein
MILPIGQSAGELQMRPGEWDAHNCYGEQDGSQNMSERQPPAGEQ